LAVSKRPKQTLRRGFLAAICLLASGSLQAAAESAATADHAQAQHYHNLGMMIQKRGNEAALRDALPWLEKAAAAEPPNPDYVGDYGGACLKLADLTDSYFLAVKGRDLLKTAIKLNPDDDEARAGLMEFYARAPWPLGNVSEAELQAAAIGQRSAKLGAENELRLGVLLEKKGRKDAAIRAYTAAIQFDPQNPAALEALKRLSLP
jgi:tetratricopeptide (TPR) repeat protein